MTETDLLNRPLTPDEKEILALYERLKVLAARDDLAPCVRANVRAALAAMWQVVNDLQLRWEHLYDIGV